MTGHNREAVLASMPAGDRLDALFDELVLGEFYAERTDEGWRRVEPGKGGVINTHDD